MVNAKLHMICGNCGCNDMFEFEIDPKGHDISDDEIKFEPAIRIKCKNCSTIHDLSNNAELVIKKRCPMLGDECTRADEQFGDLLCENCQFIKKGDFYNPPEGLFYKGAYDSGWSANERGESIDSNPYKIDSSDPMSYVKISYENAKLQVFWKMGFEDNRSTIR